MSAELTATMLVWPRPCGHGGVVLELLEHFTPFWVCRRGGRSVTARVPTRERVLVTGPRTPDLGGHASTTAMGRAIAEQVAAGAP